jgi:hypothetical protein
VRRKDLDFFINRFGRELLSDILPFLRREGVGVPCAEINAIEHSASRSFILRALLHMLKKMQHSRTWRRKASGVAHREVLYRSSDGTALGRVAGGRDQAADPDQQNAVGIKLTRRPRAGHTGDRRRPINAPLRSFFFPPCRAQVVRGSGTCRRPKCADQAG